MTLRQSLADALGPMLPSWRIVPGLAAPERITRSTVVIEHAQIGPSPDARGLISNTVNVHVITRLSGVTAAAEDDIDTIVHDVLDALEQITWITVGTATKKVYKDSNLSYEIETTMLTRRKDTTP